MKLKLIFALATLVPSLLVSAQEATQSLNRRDEIKIVITVPENLDKYQKSKKIRKKHFQFQSDSTSVTLSMAQADRLLIRKTKFDLVGQDGLLKCITLRRDSIQSYIKREQDSVWNSLMRSLEKKQLSDKTHYFSFVDRFLKGKNGGNRMINQWHTVGNVDFDTKPRTVKATISAGLFERITFTTDTLPGAAISLLPAFDEGACEPLDRFYERKKLRGYGLDKFCYERNVLLNRKIIRKTFEIYFEKNKADVTPENIGEINQFLEQNNLSILNATIEGSSSIEGMPERNRQLQELRASKLIRTLQKHNNEPIRSDTVIFSEELESIKVALQHTQYQNLDSLNGEEIRCQINSDPELAKFLEPFFKQHRKASLKLALAGRLSSEEVVAKLSRNFNFLLDQLKPGDIPANRPIEAKLLGIFEYLDKMSKAGLLSEVDIATLVDNCHRPQEAGILLFYHMIKSYEADQQLKGFQWDSTFARRKWNNLFSISTSNIITLIQLADGSQMPGAYAEKTKRLRQAEDIQFYTVKYIRDGILNPDALCEINYPHSPIFYGLRLNHLAIAYELSSAHYFSCFGFPSKDKSNTSSKIHSSEEVGNDTVSPQADYNFGNSARKGIDKPRPSFDPREKGDYYFFVKSLALSNNSAIRNYASTSDSWFEFDLYNLLRLSIDEWDPVNNHFYDIDIQLAEMNKLIRKLKAIDKRICRVDVNQLYLDYHLKSIYYLNEFYIPGDQHQMNIADYSLRYISQYYASRHSLLFPKLTLRILYQLHTFYWLPTKKSSVQHAFDILAQIDRRRLLTDPERELWNKYLKLYAPQRTNYRTKKIWNSEMKPARLKTVVIVG